MSRKSWRLCAAVVSSLLIAGCSEDVQRDVLSPSLGVHGGPKGDDNGNSIAQCGTTITQSGNYVVTHDLVDCPGDGIAIMASDVTLRLNRRSISGLGIFTSSRHGIGVGVGVAGGVRNVTIIGPGTVTGFFGGVVFEGVEDSRVSDVDMVQNVYGFPLNAGFAAGEFGHYSTGNTLEGNRLLSNVGHAVTVNGGANNLIVGNTMDENGGWGVLLYAGGSNTVRGNVARSNHTGFGVESNPDSHGHVITGNTAQGNWGWDLRDQWGDCTHNSWSANTYGSKNVACIN